MGIVDKHSSKRGKNIGGFLQLFDWNAKSRKKLFSTKSDFPEKSKQKKRFDGNLPTTRIVMDEDEYIGGGGSSVKGSSEYSCASSVADEDYHGTKAPGVVARLMGLDSLPRSNSLEPNSTPLFDCRSLPGSYCQSENLEYRHDYQVTRPKSVHDDNVFFRTTDAEQKYHRTMHNRPLEKFQTEILPPKSAKSIPVTRNRLLSPIKSAGVIRPENAAHIMEAAARIIEAGPQASAKTRLPLKVREFKEKVQTLQKPSKVVFEGERQRSGESIPAKQLRERSWNSSDDAASLKIFSDTDSVKGKGKSISLALQAKANVRKREALKEASEISPNESRKNLSLAQKSMIKKASTQNNSSVLRLNNQKQNSSTGDKEKLPSKPKLQGGKPANGDSSSTRQKNYSSKQAGTPKVSSRKLGNEGKDDKRQVLPPGSERGASKKRSIDGNRGKNLAADSVQMDQNGKAIRARDNMDVPSSWVQQSGKVESDVISFTFTAPITRSGSGSLRYNEADYCNKRMLLNTDSMIDSEFPVVGNTADEKDNLSTLLEEKLNELALKVELSKRKPKTVPHVMLPDPNTLMNSIVSEEGRSQGGNFANSLEGQQSSSICSLSDSRGFTSDIKGQYTMHDSGKNISEGKWLLQCQLPGPISVLEHSSPFAGGCSSFDTAESNNSARCIKQCSPIQFYEVFSEISDSASSTAVGVEAKGQEETILTLSNQKSSWELEYVKDILYNIEQIYTYYASGRASKIISPNLFDQLEGWKRYSNGCGVVSKTNRKVVFDCVSECMELRCREYAGGGYKLWANGIQTVKRKDKLAEDMYREICGWSAMGDFMVDELVDGDMSSRYGRWLDFEVEAFEAAVQIESRIANSLIDEVVADILML